MDKIYKDYTMPETLPELVEHNKNNIEAIQPVIQVANDNSIAIKENQLQIQVNKQAINVNAENIEMLDESIGKELVGNYPIASKAGSEQNQLVFDLSSVEGMIYTSNLKYEVILEEESASLRWLEKLIVDTKLSISIAGITFTGVIDSKTKQVILQFTDTPPGVLTINGISSLGGGEVTTDSKFGDGSLTTTQPKAVRQADFDSWDSSATQSTVNKTNIDKNNSMIATNVQNINTNKADIKTNTDEIAALKAGVDWIELDSSYYTLSDTSPTLTNSVLTFSQKALDLMTNYGNFALFIQFYDGDPGEVDISNFPIWYFNISIENRLNNNPFTKVLYSSMLVVDSLAFNNSIAALTEIINGTTISKMVWTYFQHIYTWTYSPTDKTISVDNTTTPADFSDTGDNTTASNGFNLYITKMGS